MSCELENKCFSSGTECDGCMYNDSPNSLDYFEWNEIGIEPTEEEKDEHFADVLENETPCIFESKCLNSSSEANMCDGCMYNPDATPMNHFDFNGNGDNPSGEELDEIYNRVTENGIVF